MRFSAAITMKRARVFGSVRFVATARNVAAGTSTFADAGTDSGLTSSTGVTARDPSST